ncbi:glycosyltransferase family 87 protein [Chloroflexota bacterium]
MKWWLKTGIVVVLIFWALFSIVDSVLDTQKTVSGVDIFTYWFANVHVLTGNDPYMAITEEQQLTLPFNHLNGKTTVIDTQYPSTIAPRPTALPLMVDLFIPLSFFTWPVAKVIWLITNLGLMLSVPWLVWPVIWKSELPISRWSQWTLALLFYGLLATRNNLSNGQQSIFVLWAGLVGLLLIQRNQVIGAGILFGIALSKYTLIFPFVLFLLYKRYFKVLFVAVGLQFIGGLFMALLVQTNPLTLLGSYLTIFSYSLIVFPSASWSINFAEFLPPPITTLLIVSSTILTGILLYRRIKQSAIISILFDSHVLAVLAMWSLTIVYHGYYDVIMVVIPLAIWFIAVEHPSIWALRSIGHSAIMLTLLIVSGILMLPGESFGRFVPLIGSHWGMFTRLGALCVILVLQYGTIILLMRLSPDFSHVSDAASSSLTGNNCRMKKNEAFFSINKQEERKDASENIPGHTDR